MNNSTFHKRIYGVLLISVGLCFLLLPWLPETYYLLAFHSICGLTLIIFPNEKSVKFYRIWSITNLIIICIVILSFPATDENIKIFHILNKELMFICFENLAMAIMSCLNYDLFWIEPKNIKRDEHTITMERGLIGTDINDAF